MMNHEEQYEEERRQPHQSSVTREGGRGQFIFKWFRIDTNGREQIPGLLVRGPTSPHNKSLLFVHGLGGSKEDVVYFGEVAESLGFSMLAIDARRHGERRSTITGASAIDLLGDFSGTIVDNRIAVDVAVQNGWAQEGKIILVGTSMGGVFGGVIAGVDRRISGAALHVAGGDLVEILAKSKHPIVSQISSGIPKFMFTLFKGQIATLDPINYIGRMSPRPLLLQLGRHDDFVPYETGMKLYDKAKEPKDLVVHDSGHDLPKDKAMSEIIRWIGKRFPDLL